MENLPVEILTSIFIRLHTLQKIECMSVCRRWNEVIKSRCLLETAVIHSESNNSQRFDCVMTHIKNNIFSGLCTRRLVLEDLEGETVDIMELSTLFPNLQSLSLKITNFILPMPSTNQETLSTFQRWLCQIESIFEYNEPLLIPALMNHLYQFNQLVSLSVFHDIDSQVKASTSWFDHLSNAPALKFLTLSNFFIGLSDIEVLHKNAPLITTLELVYIGFLLTGDFDFRLPNPPRVKTLSIKNCNNLFPVQERWVLYFLRSYVHLYDFTVEYLFRDEDELEELNRKNGHLNNLEFNLGEFSHVSFNSEELIRCCTMFKHLHTLVIDYFDPERFEITKEFSSLKQITLIFPYSRRMTESSKVSLNTFLIRQCPDRLESLCVKHAQVTVSLGDSQVLRRFKTLKIEYGCVDDGVPKFLSQQCPHLLELVLNSTAFSFTCINLPSHNLDLLDIDYPSSKKLFVKVNLDGDVRLYCTAFSEYYFRRDDVMLYSGVKPVQPKNLSNERVLDVVCRSIRTIVLHSRLAV